MHINADFTLPVINLPQQAQFVPSPTPGVERRMLDRIGAEVARATTIVRYAPNASFPAHTHGGGEEFYVLEGLFLDEHGAYPQGCYVRNPIGTAHAPRSGPEGALLFVKLHQFEASDTSPVRIDTLAAPMQGSDQPGRAVLPLHAHGREQVQIERWDPGAAPFRIAQEGGLEALVLEGSLLPRPGGAAPLPPACPKGGWLRLPAGECFPFQAGPQGARLYIKLGALPAA